MHPELLKIITEVISKYLKDEQVKEVVDEIEKRVEGQQGVLILDNNRDGIK
jgi:predicted DNA-binding ArsR family transcriptional regulator